MKDDAEIARTLAEIRDALAEIQADLKWFREAERERIQDAENMREVEARLQRRMLQVRHSPPHHH